MQFFGSACPACDGSSKAAASIDESLICSAQDAADLETPSVFVFDLNWLPISVVVVVFYVRVQMGQFAGESM